MSQPARTSVSGLARPSSRATRVADSLSERQWDELTDMVLRRIERNVIDDLARRGRRTMPAAK